MRSTRLAAIAEIRFLCRLYWYGNVQEPLRDWLLDCCGMARDMRIDLGDFCDRNPDEKEIKKILDIRDAIVEYVRRASDTELWTRFVKPSGAARRAGRGSAKRLAGRAGSAG